MTFNWDQLTKLQKEMSGYRPLDKEQQKQLVQNVRAEHVWSSNAIEGSRISKNETETIIEDGRTIQGELVSDILAALDLNEAFTYMLELARNKQPLTQAMICDLNRLTVAKTHPEWGGHYRTVAVRPAYAEYNPYADAFEIQPQMADLIKWAHEKQNQLQPVKYAADLHLKFVTIHPFRDGNGRTARLLMNLALIESGYPVVNVQSDKKSRDEYMTALQASQKNNDPSAFENLIGQYAEKALINRINILKLNEKNSEEAKQSNLSPSQRKYLAELKQRQNGLER